MLKAPGFSILSSRGHEETLSQRGEARRGLIQTPVNGSAHENTYLVLSVVNRPFASEVKWDIKTWLYLLKRAALDSP